MGQPCWLGQLQEDLGVLDPGGFLVCAACSGLCDMGLAIACVSCLQLWVLRSGSLGPSLAAGKVSSLYVGHCGDEAGPGGADSLLPPPSTFRSFPG